MNDLILQPAPYHWTPGSQRIFLETLSETGSVKLAADAAGMSRRAAYNLRHRRQGRAFHIGWNAAVLVARVALEDELLERALTGQTDTLSRDPDAHEVSRFRKDNRLGMSMLTRLDRRAENAGESGVEGALARLVSQDIDAFLELVERGGGGAEAALFIAARSPSSEGNRQCELVGDGDEDEDDDHEPPTPGSPQTSDQQAAGLSVWYDKDDEGWCTDFPPPPAFDGTEYGRFGEGGYQRSLSAGEEEAQGRIDLAERAPLIEAALSARDAHFGFVPEMPVAAEPRPRKRKVRRKPQALRVVPIVPEAALAPKPDAEPEAEPEPAPSAEPGPDPAPSADEFSQKGTRIYVPGTREFTGEYQTESGFRTIKSEPQHRDWSRPPPWAERVW